MTFHEEMEDSIKRVLDAIEDPVVMSKLVKETNQRIVKLSLDKYEELINAGVSTALAGVQAKDHAMAQFESILYQILTENGHF